MALTTPTPFNHLLIQSQRSNSGVADTTGPKPPTIQATEVPTARNTNCNRRLHHRSSATLFVRLLISIAVDRRRMDAMSVEIEEEGVQICKQLLKIFLLLKERRRGVVEYERQSMNCKSEFHTLTILRRRSSCNSLVYGF